MPKETAADVLSKRVRTAQDAQRPKFELFSDLDLIYRVKGKPQDSAAQLHAPDSWANVETVAPRMVSRRPTLTFKPRPDPFFAVRDEDARQRTSDRQSAVWEHWWDIDGAFDKNVAWVKGALRHGTKIVRTYWAHEESEVSDYEYGPDGKPLLDEKNVPIESVRTEVTRDDATMELLSSFDFFIDPEAIDITSAAWVIFRYRKTLDELKAYGKFTGLKELETKLTDKGNADREFADKSRIANGLGVLEDDGTVDRVTCWEMWERGPKGIRKCTVASGVTIEDWKQNPFRHRRYPFVRLVDSLVDGEFWGVGEIEPVMQFQELLDTYHSMDASNRIQSLQPKWKADGAVDEWQLFNGPVINVDTRNNIDANPIEVPDMTATSAPAISATRQTLTDALGIYDINRGDSGPSTVTATGAAIEAEQGNARFNLKIQMYEESLKELGIQVMSLYQQHKLDLFDVEVDDGQGGKVMERVAPLDIAGAFDIQVESGSSRPANREAERQDKLQVYQLMAPRGQMDPQFQAELDKFVLDAFDGTTKIKEALEESNVRVQQQQMMAQQQQEQMMQQQQAMEAQGMEQEQGEVQEKGAVEDHQARLSYFDDEESKLDRQIAQLTKQTQVAR